MNTQKKRSGFTVTGIHKGETVEAAVDLYWLWQQAVVGKQLATIFVKH